VRTLDVRRPDIPARPATPTPVIARFISQAIPTRSGPGSAWLTKSTPKRCSEGDGE
jgi:hypothetical protein